MTDAVPGRVRGRIRVREGGGRRKEEGGRRRREGERVSHYGNH